ncbi:MAG: hypothetical protein WCB96_12325 [Candidatus Aminicenantales bacterium]
MKISVCLKEVLDPALSLDFGLTNRVVFCQGQPFRLNPNDAAALVLALGLKTASRDSRTEITLISIGPERVEGYLRNGLALGADKAMRIWGDDFNIPSPWQKARLLTKAAALLGADLVLTGARSLDTAHAQVGPLLAGWLDRPCVSDVISLELDPTQNSITAVKDIGRGEREKVLCSLPAVVAVRGEGRLPYASLDKLIESKYSPITRLSPADLGVSPAQMNNDPTKVIGLVFPRPAPRKVPPLDGTLPAFDRILQLLAGGIARRQGRMLQGNSEELAEQLFRLLKEEGVLRPAAGP